MKKTINLDRQIILNRANRLKQSMEKMDKSQLNELYLKAEKYGFDIKNAQNTIKENN